MDARGVVIQHPLDGVDGRSRPVYDFARHLRSDETVRYADLIIPEGANPAAVATVAELIRSRLKKSPGLFLYFLVCLSVPPSQLWVWVPWARPW